MLSSPSCARAPVHQAHERHARAGDVLGERDRGVVGGLEHQAAQQVCDGQLLPGPQAELGLDRRRDVVGGGRPCRTASPAPSSAAPSSAWSWTRSRGASRPRARRRRRRCSPRSGSPTAALSVGGPSAARAVAPPSPSAPQQQSEREHRSDGTDPHQRSLIFVPGVSVCGSRSGLSSRIWSSGTSTFTAMPEGVSPVLIVYDLRGRFFLPALRGRRRLRRRCGVLRARSPLRRPSWCSRRR